MTGKTKINITRDWFIEQIKEKSLTEIAKELGVSYSTLISWKRKNGLSNSCFPGNQSSLRSMMKIQTYIVEHPGAKLDAIDNAFGQDTYVQLKRLYKMGMVAMSIDGRYFDSEVD